MANKYSSRGPTKHKKKTRQGAGRGTKFRTNNSGKKVNTKQYRGQGGRKR